MDMWGAAKFNQEYGLDWSASNERIIIPSTHVQSATWNVEKMLALGLISRAGVWHGIRLSRPRAGTRMPWPCSKAILGVGGIVDGKGDDLLAVRPGV